MQDAQSVRLTEGAQHRSGDLDGPRGREGLAVQQLSERATRRPVQHHGRTGLEQLAQPDHVGVAQLGERPRLAQEALQGVAARSARAGGEDLDGDAIARQCIPCLQHAGVGGMRYLAHDAVAPVEQRPALGGWASGPLARRLARIGIRQHLHEL